MGTENDLQKPEVLQEYLRVANQACDGATEILLKYFGRLKSVAEKFQAGLVTEADKESEDFIRALLQSRFPGHAFVGEETGKSGAINASHIWYVDPLDGTNNFVHQFPIFCVSIGLQIGDQLAVGVINAPKLGLRYWAVRGQGAYLNGNPIRVSQNREFSQALVATGFGKGDPEFERQVRMARLALLLSRDLRRGGAAALDLCWVANGVLDLYWERNLHPWDLAAGALIVQEAGGTITLLDGQPFDVNGRHVLACTPALHRQFLDKMREA